MRIPAWQAVVYCRSRLEGRLSEEVFSVFFVLLIEYGSSAFDACFGANSHAAAVVQNVFIGGEGCVFREQIQTPEANFGNFPYFAETVRADDEAVVVSAAQY
jgi:hypothetical protein